MFYLEKNTRMAKNESISKNKENHKVPDGDNVRKKHNKSEKIAEPRTHKSLQRYQDNRQNHLGQEQGLGEAVKLQVQKTNLSGRHI